LVIAILLATLASGCLFGPSIECDSSADLTEAECARAAQAALANLSTHPAATKVVLRSACPRDRLCPSTVQRLFIGVEISFNGTEQLAWVYVSREHWEASEPRFVSQSPSSP
jgi:hypothetical protein